MLVAGQLPLCPFDLFDHLFRPPRQKLQLNFSRLCRYTEKARRGEARRREWREDDESGKRSHTSLPFCGGKVVSVGTVGELGMGWCP